MLKFVSHPICECMTLYTEKINGNKQRNFIIIVKIGFVFIKKHYCISFFSLKISYIAAIMTQHIFLHRYMHNKILSK